MVGDQAMGARPMQAAELSAQCLVWLTETFKGVYTNGTGASVIPLVGTTAVLVEVADLPDGLVQVNVRSPVLTHLQPTDGLIRHLALYSGKFLFGALNLYVVEDQVPTLEFGYALFGHTVDRDLLIHVVGFVGGTADAQSRELRKQFGGSFVNG
jgi:hypothetical protein